MATTLMFKTIEAEDATGFIIRDSSVWDGVDVSTASVAKLTISSTQVEDDVIEEEIDLLAGTSPLLTDMVTNGFFEVLASSISRDSFYDGFYSMNLLFTVGGVDYEYDDAVGFLAYARCKSRRLPVLLSEDVQLSYTKNESNFSIYMYLDSAEAAASVGHEAEFTNILEWVNYAYNLKGITL